MSKQIPSYHSPQRHGYAEAYKEAYSLACRELQERSDAVALCRKSGAVCDDKDPAKSITLRYMGRDYAITLTPIAVSSQGEGEVPITDKILLLHYLLRAKGTPPSNRLITLKELPEGVNYFPTFYKRAIKPLEDAFGAKPELIYQTASMFGAKRADCADAAVTINALPRVPLTLAVWRGDDEFPPAASILFDANIADYLCGEDTIILCQNISWKLAKAAWSKA